MDTPSDPNRAANVAKTRRMLRISQFLAGGAAVLFTVSCWFSTGVWERGRDSISAIACVAIVIFCGIVSRLLDEDHQLLGGTGGR